MNTICPKHKIEYDKFLWCPVCLEEDLEEQEEEDREYRDLCEFEHKLEGEKK